MKLKKVKYLIFAILLILMNSCESKMFFTTLDVLKPAEVTFPSYVNNVVIVNNSVPQPASFGHTSTSLLGKISPESLKFDSAGIFITSALRGAVDGKLFFKRVDLSLVNQNTSGSYNYLNKLSDEQINSLFRMYNADAIIALNKISLSDDAAEYYLDDGSYYNELDVNVKTDWSIYYKNIRTKNLQFADSFLWQSSNYNRKMAKDSLPKRYDALVDASILTGGNIADRMIPRWEKEDRFFFVNKDKLMTQAMDSVPYRKWGKAIELWKNAAESSKSIKIKFQSYNNIAVAYEILGDIDNAVIYINKALIIITENYGSTNNNRDSYYVASYHQDLIKRKKEMKLLKQQLGN